MAKKAYDLNQQLGLYPWHDSYYTNYRGVDEKYLCSADGTSYFLLPNGALYRWEGSIAGSTLVDTFNSAYYDNPTLLHDAQAPALTPVDSSDVSLSVSGNVLNITRAADYNNEFYVQVTLSDGLAAASETFKVSVTNSALVLAAIG